MDLIDLKIIEALSKDAQVTATKLAKELHFSVPAVNKRIKALKKNGTIKNFTIITDNKKLGKPIIAFVLVSLKTIEHAETFFRYVDSDRDILECYTVTGEYDCMLKVCASSVESLDDKLSVLKRSNGVMKSYTILALTTQKYQPTVLADFARD